MEAFPAQRIRDCKKVNKILNIRIEADARSSVARTTRGCLQHIARRAEVGKHCTGSTSGQWYAEAEAWTILHTSKHRHPTSTARFLASSPNAKSTCHAERKPHHRLMHNISQVQCATHQEGEPRCNIAKQRLSFHGAEQMHGRSDPLHPLFAPLLSLLVGLPLSGAKRADAVRSCPYHIVLSRWVAKMI